MTSRSNAPLYSANFFSDTDPISERDTHERRLALALDLDTSARLMSTASFSSASPSSVDAASDPVSASSSGNLVWQNNEWDREGSTISL
jgi:hypothetical protein